MTELATDRLTTDYKNLSDRFSKQNPDFSKQYCSIYVTRLHKVYDLLVHQSSKKWGTTYPICKLHKLSEAEYDKCIVIGTLFKDQKLKPSILKQLSETNHFLPQLDSTHFTDESDTLFIEDELQRYQILGTVQGEKLVTGITCALLGKDIGKGKFMAEDYCFVNYQPQVQRPLLQNDTYVVFISSLDLIHAEKSLLSLQFFIDWISGLLGNINEIETSKIVRLVIAGNSVSNIAKKNISSISLTSRAVQSQDTVDAVKLLDAVLLQLCQLMEVDIMPGENDPSNYILPQKPMHHCMFPNAMTYKSLTQASNPYDFELGGLRILGSAGQPVRDILRFCDISEPIDVLERCLEWNHLAPTAPDTLGCYPFYENDPFIIEECPHIFFVGNQQKFDTKICNGSDGQSVRLICVPEFSNSCTVAVLNLKTLDCVPIVFKGF